MENKKSKNMTTELNPRRALTQAEKEERIKALKIQQEKDKEMVRGIFHYHEVPGGGVSFVYKAYKGDAVQRYDLVDGQMHTIPLGVARHLNKNGWYPVHMHAKDEHGRPTIKIGQRVRRFGFASLEFVDIDDLTPVGSPLITIEHMPIY